MLKLEHIREWEAHVWVRYDSIILVFERQVTFLGGKAYMFAHAEMDIINAIAEARAEDRR